ncbi:MAG TPA: alpha/beta hydrolase [Verrucomicrobiae bacterium]|nr:alpha/beta hydrolase [Verrucomicrobiae bacterium]
MIRWFEHRQVYAPSCDIEFAPERQHEDIQFKASDGVKLHGWFFPGSKREHLAFLIFHGNAGNICHRLHFYDAWLELGVSVFAFDYRGYGQSQGTPSEVGTYLDGQAAYAWLRQRGFAPENIILLGKSLGGGIASEIALREKVGGLILQNTFSSIPDVGRELFPFLPVRLIGSIRYETVKKLPRIHAPVLVMHSHGDDFIRFGHAERNFAAAKEPKMFWEIHGTHNGTIEADRAHYLSGLRTFLDRYFK